MPKTAKEIAEVKLESLKKKLEQAQHRIDKFEEKVENPSQDLQSYILVLENLHLSMDEFVSNLNAKCSKSETDKGNTLTESAQRKSKAVSDTPGNVPQSAEKPSSK